MFQIATLVLKVLLVTVLQLDATFKWYFKCCCPHNQNLIDIIRFVLDFMVF